jgi:hypothetical protein
MFWGRLSARSVIEPRRPGNNRVISVRGAEEKAQKKVNDFRIGIDRG